MYLATKTISAIDEAIEYDQGATFRMWLGRVLPHISDAYREDEDGFRSHMGASMLGRDCARSIWYSFYWYTESQFSGRMLRLFNRGHLEEGRFIAALLTIGALVIQHDESGNQFRIQSSGGHVGGSGDGIGARIPDLYPNVWALYEFKTGNEKNYSKLIEDGVREVKWEHYVQMNIYMYKMGLPVALYMSVNKNDDNIHAELIQQDAAIAEQYLARGHKLVFMRTPPKRISESSSFWKCKFCDHMKVCHLRAKPAVNCRTCKFSEPLHDGTWACNSWQQRISKETQLKGCERYVQAS